MSATFRTIAKLIVGLIMLVPVVDGVSARDATPAGIVTGEVPLAIEPSPTPDESLTASDLSEYTDLLLLFSGPEVTPQNVHRADMCASQRESTAVFRLMGRHDV